VPGASGFKVARVTDSAIPEAEDRLVDCIYQEYEKATGMPRHPNSVTDNMTNYHAFREIEADTPGAIIEIGFMLDDRIMLTEHREQLAQGIVAGVTCFLEHR
jgi:N-acetylmuramoyl-L-alanine amidase